MSDPGTTYRNRDEVEGVRKSRDPIVKVHQWLIDHKLATEDELTAITDEVKKEVDVAVEFAASSPMPSPDDLYKFVYIVRGSLSSASHAITYDFLCRRICRFAVLNFPRATI
jgi:TPP-dependent pyruvate/acetoin dehydrogenase alpha subunit